jgi:hypothetical protein
VASWACGLQLGLAGPGRLQLGLQGLPGTGGLVGGVLLAQRGQLVHLLAVGLDLAVQRLALGGQGLPCLISWASSPVGAPPLGVSSSWRWARSRSSSSSPPLAARAPPAAPAWPASASCR